MLRLINFRLNKLNIILKEDKKLQNIMMNN